MPQTPSRPCWQTRPVHQNLFRPEPRPEGSLISPSSLTTPKLASKSPLAPRDFQVETHLCYQFRGFTVGGKAGVAAGPPQGSHTMEKRGKAELRKPRQGDLVSSKARNVKPAPRHCSTHADGGSRALPIIHHRAWSWDRGKQPGRPPGSRLLTRSTVLGPHPKPLRTPEKPSRSHLPLAESPLSWWRSTLLSSWTLFQHL